jgi:hypothetical protein
MDQLLIARESGMIMCKSFPKKPKQGNFIHMHAFLLC